MKRFLRPALGGALLALGLAPALAETVTYPDDPLVTLQTLRSFGVIYNNSLAPSFTTDGAGYTKSTAVSGGSASAPTNLVTLNSGAAIDPNLVFGAFNGQDTAAVSYNRVVINGGTVSTTVCGGLHFSGTGNINASYNSVAINGGTVNFRVYGGHAFSASGNVTTTDNTVEISGGTVDGWVVGGSGYSSSGATEVRNNTVKISGSPNLAGARLYGGIAETSTGAATTSTGNTLQMATADLGVMGLADFQNFSFTLPANPASWSNTVLTVTDTADIGTNSTVSVTAASGLSVAKGDVITLIDAGSGLIGSVAAASQHGVLKGYEYTLSISGNKLLLAIDNPVPAATSTVVPTLSEYALALLAFILAVLTFITLRRKV